MKNLLNFTLYKREMRRSLVLLTVFGAVLAMYVSIIVTMYGSDTIELMEGLGDSIADFMTIMGMTGAPSSLLGFLSSFLYGFLLLVFPMIFTILCANRLLAQYVDRGSMVSLLAAPVKRSTVAFTQMKVLGSGIVILILFVTLIQIIVSASSFPGELDVPRLLLLNFGLLCFHLFIGGICFFASALANDTKLSIGLGAGIPTFMFILQMLSNAGEQTEAVKYLTFFSLFNADKIIAGDTFGIAGIFILLGGAIALFAGAIVVFSKKDLHI